MSPTTYSSIRRTKNTQGVYLLNPDPSVEERLQLWGTPATLTTAMPDGTALGGNFEEAARIFVRDRP
ncbi:MAG: hypothetical protein JWM67_3289 [Mycobacterium sp.]|nr:hypothetical protein [Mycobacterium sp.]